MQNALMNVDEQRSQTHWRFVAEPGWSAAFRMGSRLWCWSEPGSDIFPQQNGALVVHEHLQTLRRWYKVKRREAPPSQPTCSSGALWLVGCFGCTKSRLSSVIAQKQMCAKLRTLPAQNIGHYLFKIQYLVFLHETNIQKFYS